MKEKRWVKVSWRSGSIATPNSIDEITPERAQELQENDWANGRNYTLLQTDKTVDQLWEEYDRH
jgi:hypothetical protein